MVMQGGEREGEREREREREGEGFSRGSHQCLSGISWCIAAAHMDGPAPSATSVMFTMLMGLDEVRGVGHSVRSWFVTS
jgi:hypothetical protein